MSEAVSVLDGARFGGLITVEEAGLQGMITLRGDLSSAGFAKAVTSVTDLVLPEQRKIILGEDMALAWMSPDELLLLLPYEMAGAVAIKLSEALAGTHALVQNVSDARALFTLTGAPGPLREVLAKLAPVDLAPDAFVPGDFRRTRIAQIAGAFWLSEATTAHLICFRSVAGYAFSLLTAVSAEGGEVGYF